MEYRQDQNYQESFPRVHFSAFLMELKSCVFFQCRYSTCSCSMADPVTPHLETVTLQLIHTFNLYLNPVSNSSVPFQLCVQVKSVWFLFSMSSEVISEKICFILTLLSSCVWIGLSLAHFPVLLCNLFVMSLLFWRTTHTHTNLYLVQPQVLNKYVNICLLSDRSIVSLVTSIHPVTFLGFLSLFFSPLYSALSMWKNAI